MKTLKLAAIALCLFAFVACNSKESTPAETTTQPTPAQTEKEKTKVTYDGKTGEVGFENKDVDVDVKVNPDPKKD